MLQRWLAGELDTLHQMKDSGSTLAEIAAALSTTLCRVKNRLAWENKDPDQRRIRRLRESVRRQARQPQWTPAEIEIARGLVARRATDKECQAAVGRTFHACYQRVDREERQLPRARPTPQPIITPEIMEAAVARLYAPRPLTAWVFGDPAPGFSALDRRREQRV
jgi:hypothetical protein